MKKNISLIVLIILLLVTFFVLREKKISTDSRAEVGKAVIVFPNGKIEYADVADEQAERVLGLSNKQVPQSMLFLFQDKSVQSFWMKDMNFPIDLIWMDDQRIVGFERNMQPETPVHTLYTSPSAINAVLELPTGTVDELSLKTGEMLDIKWRAQ